ncbi:helix-turn-helix domain-containing protein [Campylobacter concisus]
MLNFKFNLCAYLSISNLALKNYLSNFKTLFVHKF